MRIVFLFKIFFLLLIVSVFPQQAQLSEARVLRVIDGDTLILEGGERVRLIGLDAPEIGEPGASEATQFVREKVEGRIIWLEADGDDRDRYGRLRRYVWLQIPMNSQDENQIRQYQLNAMLLENGLAAVLIVGRVKNEALFRRLAANAPSRPWAAQGGIIGNINSLIFHISDCNQLPNQQNRIYFNDREAAINAGYRPCQRCRP